MRSTHPRRSRVRAALALTVSILALDGCAGCLGLDGVTFDDTDAGSASSASSTSASTDSASSSGGRDTTGGAGGEGGVVASSSGTSTGGGQGGIGQGGGGSGPGGGGSCPNGEERSDEFTGDALDEKWTELEDAPGLLDDYVVGDDDLTFGSPANGSQWYGEGPGGPFVYQEVEGDFFAWTRIRVTTNGEDDPTDTYHGAGLLLREPLQPPGDTETFIIGVVGVAGVEGICRVGGNVAVGGVSPKTYELPGQTPCAADIALCRKSNETRVFGRMSAGDTWLEMEFATDLVDEVFPEVLQVGPAVYSYLGDEPTIGEFDFVRFEPTCDRTCDDILLAIEGE